MPPTIEDVRQLPYRKARCLVSVTAPAQRPSAIQRERTPE